MDTDTRHLIAAICPEVFCEPAARKEVRRILREGFQEEDPLVYLKAAQKAVPLEPGGLDLESLQSRNLFTLPGLEDPVERRVLVRDALGDSLERVYFALLDLLGQEHGWNVTQILDTVHATPASASAHRNGPEGIRSTAELMQQFQAAQESARDLIQSMRRLDDTRARIREPGGVMPDIDIRPVPPQPDGASPSGFNPGLPQLAVESGIDPQGANGPDPNPASLQAQLLRGQELRLSAALPQLVQKLRLHQRALAPLLPAHLPDRHRPPSGTALVAAFNSAAIHVHLLATQPVFRDEEIVAGRLPRGLGHARHRAAMPVLLVELSFRSMPEAPRTGGLIHRGRASITVTSCALRQDELDLLQCSIDEARLLGFAQQLGFSGDADLRRLCRALREAGAPAPPTAPISTHDLNPFAALWSGLRSILGLTTQDPDSAPPCCGPLPPDTAVEKAVRSSAALAARAAAQQVDAALRKLFTAVPFPPPG